MRSKVLCLVQENHATVKPSVKPDSSVAPRGMKTYSGSRIERRNLQIFKRMPKIASHFLSSEKLCEPKSLDLASKIAEVKKNTLGNGLLLRHPKSHLIRVLNKRSFGECRHLGNRSMITVTFRLFSKGNFSWQGCRSFWRRSIHRWLCGYAS